MPACLAGQPLPAGADPYADPAWRQRLPVNPESRQFPVGVLLSSLSEIVAWSRTDFNDGHTEELALE